MTCSCGSTAGVRLYAGGYRCRTCAPWALAGLPEPGQGRYCMAICYCGGSSCQGRRDAPLAPVTATVIDINAVASGKRRARSLTEYRDAQRTRTEHTA